MCGAGVAKRHRSPKLSTSYSQEQRINPSACGWAVDKFVFNRLGRCRIYRKIIINQRLSPTMWRIVWCPMLATRCARPPEAPHRGEDRCPHLGVSPQKFFRKSPGYPQVGTVLAKNSPPTPHHQVNMSLSSGAFGSTVVFSVSFLIRIIINQPVQCHAQGST